MTTTKAPDSTESRKAAISRARLATRIEGTPAWVVFIRLFIGLGWLRAVAEKLIEPAWRDGTEIIAFVEGYSVWTLGWYRPIVDNLVVPNFRVILVILIAAQAFAAVTLLSGRLLAYGIGVGIFMNLNFLVAGSVDPNVFYLLSQGAIAFWLVERGAASKWRLRTLSLVATTIYALAMVSIPSITTLHPTRVIIDPAMMFVFLALAAIVACDQAHRRMTGFRGLPAVDWVLRREVPDVTVDAEAEVVEIR
ncbi:MAG: hypothetical protein ACFCU2_13350 [Acidimicrobiia bacterium]